MYFCLSDQLIRKYYRKRKTVALIGDFKLKLKYRLNSYIKRIKCICKQFNFSWKGQCSKNKINWNGFFFKYFLIWLPLFSLFLCMYVHVIASYPLHPSSIRSWGWNPQLLDCKPSALNPRPVFPNLGSAGTLEGFRELFCLLFNLNILYLSYWLW